jgi:hypothetical protein
LAKIWMKKPYRIWPRGLLPEHMDWRSIKDVS